MMGVEGGLDSRIIVSDTRLDAGRATYVTLVFRGGRVNSTSSSHLGRVLKRHMASVVVLTSVLQTNK